MFKEFLKFVTMVFCLIALGCGILFLIVSQEPLPVVYKTYGSNSCVKVMIGSKEMPCSDFPDEQIRNSEIVFVDELSVRVLFGSKIINE